MIVPGSFSRYSHRALRMFAKPKKISLSSNFRYIVEFCILKLSILLISFLAIRYSNNAILPFSGQNLWGMLANTFDKSIVGIFGAAEIVDFESSIRFLHSHFKSIFGTWVWGHSEISNTLYAILLVAWLYCHFLVDLGSFKHEANLQFHNCSMCCWWYLSNNRFIVRNFLKIL